MNGLTSLSPPHTTRTWVTRGEPEASSKGRCRQHSISQGTLTTHPCQISDCILYGSLRIHRIWEEGRVACSPESYSFLSIHVTVPSSACRFCRKTKQPRAGHSQVACYSISPMELISSDTLAGPLDSLPTLGGHMAERRVFSLGFIIILCLVYLD